MTVKAWFIDSKNCICNVGKRILNIRLKMTKSGYNLYIGVIFYLPVSFLIKKGYNNQVEDMDRLIDDTYIIHTGTIVPALYCINIVVYP